MGVVCPAALMEDIGYTICSSVTKFNRFLSPFLPLKEESIAKMIGLICRTHTDLPNSALSVYEYPNTEFWNEGEKSDQKLTTWNIDVFVETIKNLKVSVCVFI